MKKSDKQKREELDKEIQSTTSGREMELIERMHKKELKKYYNQN